MSALEELRELVESERTTGGRLLPDAWPLLGALAVAEELAGIRAVLEETATRPGEAAPNGRRWAVWGR